MALAALHRGNLRSRLLSSEVVTSSPELETRTVDGSTSSLPCSVPEPATSSSRKTADTGSAARKCLDREVDRVAAAARQAIVNGRKALVQVGHDAHDVPLVGWSRENGIQAGTQARQDDDVPMSQEMTDDVLLSSSRADLLVDADSAKTASAVTEAIGNSLGELRDATSDALSGQIFQAAVDNRFPPGSPTIATVQRDILGAGQVSSVALSSRSSAELSGSVPISATDVVLQQQQQQARQERRRASELEMERRAVELERQHERRYQQKVVQTRDADERARECEAELQTMREQKQDREQGLRDEVMEVRQSMNRAQVSAKAKARALRDTRDRTEKAVDALRAEAKASVEECDAAARSIRPMSASLRREVVALQDKRVVSTSMSEELAMQLRSSEQSCTQAGQEYDVLRKEAIGLRAIARDLGTRASGQGATSEGVGMDAVESAIVAKVAEEAAERSAKCEEAAINAELSGVEVRCLSLSMEEQTVSRRLGNVEAEAGRLKEALRRAPGLASTSKSQPMWQLTEERDAARLQLNVMHRNIEREAAAVVLQAAMDEASATAECHEDAACAELAHVCDQLRGTVSGKERDLAALASMAQEQQTSVLDVHDAKSLSVMEDIMAHAEASQEMALGEHAEVVQQLQSQHVRFVCETEMMLCDLVMVQAELSEAHRQEDSHWTSVKEKVQRARSTESSGVFSIQGPSKDVDGASLDMDRAMKPLQQHRANLASAVAEHAVDNRQPAQLTAALRGRLQQLQVELSEVKTSLHEATVSITNNEMKAEEAAAQVVDVVAPFTDDYLEEISKTLEVPLKLYDDQCAELSTSLIRIRSALETKRRNFMQDRSACTDKCKTLESAFEEEVARKQIDLAETEAKVQGLDEQIASLETVLKDAMGEYELVMRRTETESEVTERMRDRLAALGTADEELHARYKMLSKRAEDAARACSTEERTARATRAELAAIQQNVAEYDSALRAQTVSLESVMANYSAVLASAESRQVALNREESRPGEVAGSLSALSKQLASERVAAESLEVEARSEQEETRMLAKRLASARLEASEIRRTHEDETKAVSRLRDELSSQSRLDLPPPTLSDSFGRELERMHGEVESLCQEEAHISTSRSSLSRELHAAQEQRVKLQQALHAQEENDAKLRAAQRTASQRVQQDRVAEIAALGAAAASERAKIERANVALEEAMRSIGPLHGELLCTEAAGTTEAEALVMVRNDMDVESEACNAMRLRLSTARSELAGLKAQLAERKVSGTGAPSASPGQFYRGDDGENDVQRDRIDMDVVEVVSQAIRAVSPASDSATEGLAAVGTAQFARQLLEAQAMLEELHHQELLAIRERGRTWRRNLEDEAAEHQAREAHLEQLIRTEQWAWAADHERLSQRVRSGEREHVQLEHNLLKEISRRETAAADGASMNVAQAESASAGASPWMAEAALGLEAAAGGDGTVLARMNNSLRDTHHLLCDQQKQIEEVSRERDRLQAHLISALERASFENSGLAPPDSSASIASPPLSLQVGLGSMQQAMAMLPPSPPSAELSAGLHALLQQMGSASSPTLA